ncbi:MAG: retroviral-like aspartic protease family protein [Candidatus Kapaibacterium sp.]
MATNIPWVGHTLEDGTPVLRILISGPEANSRSFEAIVDTGFNGFLSIPQSDADSLGLEPLTTERVFFADNSEHIRRTSLATVTVGSQSQTGMIYFEPASSEVLLGVEFFLKFDRMFLFYPMEQFVQCIEPSNTAELIAHITR